jgi:hypothetical protein
MFNSLYEKNCNLNKKKMRLSHPIMRFLKSNGLYKLHGENLLKFSIKKINITSPRKFLYIILYVISYLHISKTQSSYKIYMFLTKSPYKSFMPSMKIKYSCLK